MANVAMDSQDAADPAQAESRHRPKRLPKPAQALLYGSLIAVELAWIGAIAYVVLRIT
jgi:hypothetical protein